MMPLPPHEPATDRLADRTGQALTGPPQVEIEADLDAHVNFAMQQNDVPVVKQVRLRNPGRKAVEDVVVRLWIDADLSDVWERRVAAIAGGATFRLDPVDLPLRAQTLVHQTEREAAHLHAEVSVAGEVVTRATWPLQILAFNEWGGIGSLPEMLAAFVLPNHPAIEEILAEAGRVLAERTGDAALSGYQRKSRERVRAMVEAIYQALAAREIGYINPPASYERQGQKVRLPDQVLERRLGTCLDLTLLLAACLEQAGLHPLIVMVEGHAFVGVWLEEASFPEATVEEPLRVRKRAQLDEILLIEATALTARPPMDLAQAQKAAMRRMEDTDAFLCAVDIHTARTMSIRPLPLRVAAGTYEVVERPVPGSPGEQGVAVVEPRDTTAPSDRGVAPLPGILPGALPGGHHSHPPEDHASQPSPTEHADHDTEDGHARLDRWKRKLLDLSLRNRILNYRDTKKSVPLLCPDVAGMEDVLAEGEAFVIQPQPRLMDPGQPRDQSIHLQRTGQDALETYLTEQLAKRRLHADLSQRELDRRLLETYRAARTALEESGTGTLYLALGFLSWYESDDSQTQRRAPLLLVPVNLERQSVGGTFRLSQADEEPRINVTLLEKLRVEFGLKVEGLDELTADESGLDVRAILNRFRQLIKDIDRWDVLEEACLGMFSFTKFLMWRDLQDRAGALMQNPVVRHLVERSDAPFEAGPFPDPGRLDEERAPDETFCPRDADSSQLAAIFAAHDGRSYVLEGPPGTGKSQTITNLIAHCLGHGKRVLFVSEKMAALNVVHRRLSEVGLGPFCLELHSHRASKREVLAQIQQALDVTGDQPPVAWGEHAEKLARSRAQLNHMVQALHQPRPLGLTLYQVTSRLIGLRDAPRLEVRLKDATRIKADQLDKLREVIERLITAAGAIAHPAEHPLRAIGREQWQAALPDQLQRQMAGVGKAGEALNAAVMACLEALGLGEEDPCATGSLPASAEAGGFEKIQDTGGQAASGGSGTPANPEDDGTTDDTAGQAFPGGHGTRSTLSEEAFAWLDELASLLLEDPRPSEALLSEPDWKALRPMLDALIEQGRQRDRQRATLLERYRDEVFEQDLTAMRAQLARGMQRWPILAWLTCRGVRRRMADLSCTGKAPPNDELLKDLDALGEVARETQALRDPQGLGEKYFGLQWRQGEAAWDQLDAILDWTQRFRTHLLHADALHRDPSLLRRRCIDLACHQRDQTAPEAAMGQALRTFQAAWQAWRKALAALNDLAQVDQPVAWGQPDQPGHLGRVAATIAQWQAHLPELNAWCHWRRTRAQAEQAGLRPLIRDYETGVVMPEQFRPAVERTIYEQWFNAVTDADPMLRQFNQAEQQRRIEAFRELDQRHIELTRDFLAARLAAAVPMAQADPADASEMGILQRQLRLQRRHMPVRKLIQKLPHLLPRLKPCLLMSPLSVAQYLDTSFPPFDLVVFDEASQIPVWDAVGAIARGTQAVVVGDSKQLPPTNFFMKLDDDEQLLDEDDFEELESVLDECAAAGLPSMRLLWHYRSRHESLITFSNYHYYDNRLHTFPSPVAKSQRLGVSMRYLPDGIYDRGRSRANQVEAQAVVEEVVRRLRAPGDEDAKSIGIVTFSMAQQMLIEDLLDQARRDHPEIEPYFGSDLIEPVFVKNLENVQGDERAVILFSVCYGPDQAGRVAMNFGPLNREGGERRLNVAITRAREQVIVFSSLRPDQIDLSRTNCVGVKHLKTFLDYAQRGPQALAEAVSLDPAAQFDSPFEKAVHEALTARGWQVDAQVGCSGYRIDLAVRDPQRPGAYLLGIECDGAFYHSARTARDRDRLRQGVLEDLGWRLHRIWSRDWWLNPHREVERIEAAIEQAREEVIPPELELEEIGDAADSDDPGGCGGPPEVVRHHGSLEDTAAPEKQACHGTTDGHARGVADSAPATPEPPEAPEPPATRRVAAPPELSGQAIYAPYEPPHSPGAAEDFLDPNQRQAVRQSLLAIVEHEAPLAMPLAAKRLTALWGVARLTGRVSQHVDDLLAELAEMGEVCLVDGFIWLPQAPPKSYAAFRVPAEGEPAPRRPEEIPPHELANACQAVLRQQISLPAESLAREVGRLFGLTRMTPRLQDAVDQALAVLEAQGGCHRHDGTVTLPRHVEARDPHSPRPPRNPADGQP